MSDKEFQKYSSKDYGVVESFPEIAPGIDAESLLSALQEGREAELPDSLSMLTSLLSTLKIEAIEDELANEVEVVDAIRAEVLAGHSSRNGSTVVTPLLNEKSNLHKFPAFTHRTTSKAVAAAAVIMVLSSGVAAATGSLPRGVQNVVARIVKDISAISLPSRQLVQAAPQDSTTTTGVIKIATNAKSSGGKVTHLNGDGVSGAKSGPSSTSTSAAVIGNNGTVTKGLGIASNEATVGASAARGGSSVTNGIENGRGVASSAVPGNVTGLAQNKSHKFQPQGNGVVRAGSDSGSSTSTTSSVDTASPSQTSSGSFNPK